MNSKTASPSLDLASNPAPQPKPISQQPSPYALAFALVLSLTVFAVPSLHAQTYKEKILYTFTGTSDGGMTYAGLISDAKGNLYTTTPIGGKSTGCGGSSCGNVFRLTKGGQWTSLYSFEGPPDGAVPLAGLISDAQGNFYGTTSQGGPSGAGTVFRVSPGGKEKRLYNFTGSADGGQPCSVLLSIAGNLYGVASQGGKFGFGTIFKVTTTMKETVLYNFTAVSYPQAQGPCAGLIPDAMGNLYGTTYFGGTVGLGSVFKLTKAGKFTVLYSFRGSTDGAFPVGALLSDLKGNLYGTASEGGDLSCGNGSGCGAVLKLDKTGKETTLFSFTGSSTGAFPYSALISDAKGNLLGTTSRGGTAGFGTAFRLTKAGKETVLHNFLGGNDGVTPYAGLISDAKGDLYGTTYQGGGDGAGTVFELIP